MADEDRPLEEPTDAIKRIDAALADLASTMIARLARKPTGDIEETILATPKDGTLFCQGQLVSRTTYAALWDWVQANGRVQPGLFTVGDGSTTFGVPDFRGRFLVGAGALSPDTYAVGATGGGSLKTLAVGNLPAHTHTGATSNNTHDHGSAGGHSHPGSGALADGNHGGHFPVGGPTNAAAGADFGLAAWNSGGSGGGNHNHSLSLSNDGSHTHTGDTHNHAITMDNTGSGTAFDARPAFLAINYAIWT